MATQPFDAGMALLLQTDHECVTALAHRVGPLWRSWGWAKCAWERPYHPFSYSGRGQSWHDEGVQTVLAMGVVYSDHHPAW
ncbi:MAG TPA: hypothetical protein VD969_20150 [Symbiobacteriaceae bacterium]|nr:hypothetical protein [Symbiobacteriaceae bacterium]